MREIIQCYASAVRLCLPVGEKGIYLTLQSKKPTFVTLIIVRGLSLIARASNASWERYNKEKEENTGEKEEVKHIFHILLKVTVHERPHSSRS